MSYVMFNPTDATKVASFQGALAGTMAGQASITGVGTAATEVYNQSGYYALQDTDTGEISLQKLGNESLFTNEWYSQSLDTTFDFSDSDATSVDSSSLSSGMSASEIASLFG
ncbi:MAG: hypothetical protein LUE64_01080 [Candidatus Gastranaerophilales bacterium]|nr:hypothetical protein [Candidatus Gastranaerophilales bacterium]